MTDHNKPPRRLSMAYILGFSDRPFKDAKPSPTPRPPQANAVVQMVTTPGGIMEWTASDGRKGTVTSTGKQRLTSASLAKVPSEKRSVKEALGGAVEETKAPTGKAPSAKTPTVKAPTVKAASVAGDLLNIGGVLDDKKEDKGNPHNWTEEDDKKLMDWKNENGNAAWNKCGEEVGKPEHECKERFKQIKPKDWMPNAAKGGGGGKKGKNKGKDQNQGQAQGQGQGKKDEKKDGASGGDGANPDWNNDTSGAAANGWDKVGNTNGATNGNSNGNQDTWGTGDTFGDNNGGSNGNDDIWNTGGDANGNAWGATADTGGDGAATSTNAAAGNADDPWGTAAASGNADNTWGTPNDAGNTGGWPTTDNQAANGNANTNNATTGNTWDTPAPANPAPRPASKPPSHNSKSASHHSSPKKSPPPVAPTPSAASPEIQLRPDDIFSTDDLILIARILQQDSKMVWNRLSWRFRDKTGRTLHADVFEKKITGGMEGKESGRGGGRRG